MSEMIEEMSREFARAEGWTWANLHEIEDTSFGWGRFHIRQRMGDMLAVVRTPTSEMLEAGRQLQSIGDETLDCDDMRAKYQAMIDAALNPSATRPAEALAESDRSQP